MIATKWLEQNFKFETNDEDDDFNPGNFGGLTD